METIYHVVDCIYLQSLFRYLFAISKAISHDSIFLLHCIDVYRVFCAMKPIFYKINVILYIYA